MREAEPQLLTRQDHQEPKFEARLFGDFRVVSARSGEIVGIRSRRSCAILAYLILSAGRPVGRDRLIDLLWSSRGDEQGRASLRQALTELRASAAGDALAISRTTVTAKAGLILTEFELVARAGDLSGAADLIDGLGMEVLGGLDGIDPEFDNWLAQARAGIVDRLVEAAIALCAQANDAALLPCRRRIVAVMLRLDPADERLVRLGMESDRMAGDQGALHKRYRSLEALLQREFQALPSQETQALLRELATSPGHEPEPILADHEMRPITPSPPRRREPPVVVILPILALDLDKAVIAQFCRAELETAFGGIAELRLVTLDKNDPEAVEQAAGGSIMSYSLRGWLSGAGDKLRLQWLLVRIQDGLMIWSRAFDVPSAALGVEIAGVVAQVAGAVLPAVERDLETALAATSGIGDPSAYELYFQGRMLMLGGGGLADKRRAASLFEQAITLDPRLLNAHNGLARLYNTDFEQCIAGHDTAPLRERAFQLSAHAVSLDRGSARVRARLGWCYLRRGDAANARTWLEDALTVSPHHAECLNEVGFAFLHLGELDRAAELLTRASTLNPFPRPPYFADTGACFLLMGDHARAEAQFEIARCDMLHYRALRIANRALLDGTGRRDADALRNDLRMIWASDRSPEDEALLLALFAYLPFYRAEDRAMLARGLALAGWRLSPASVGAPVFDLA